MSMRVLAWVMWAVTIIWLTAAVVGALNFQQFYGGTSGFQVVGVAVGIGLVPGLIGLWAHRRKHRQDQNGAEG